MGQGSFLFPRPSHTTINSNVSYTCTMAAKKPCPRAPYILLLAVITTTTGLATGLTVSHFFNYKTVIIYEGNVLILSFFYSSNRNIQQFFAVVPTLGLFMLHCCHILPNFYQCYWVMWLWCVM